MVRFLRPAWLLGGVLTALLPACGDKVEPKSPEILSKGCPQELDNATWEGSVQAIFAQHCTLCHSDSISASGRNRAQYHTYGEAVKKAREGLAAINRGSMPPFGDRVPDDDVCVLSAWIQAGFPEK